MPPPAVISWDFELDRAASHLHRLAADENPNAEFRFSRSAGIRRSAAGSRAAKNRSAAGLTDAPSAKPTRIKPPRDVIKLEDRLCYLLQPSLESLLSEGSLSFPFRPFPYQFEGVAFLYPRHAAILADEMGLGKTMQAITADPPAFASRRSAKRPARLPEAAGDQLAAGIPAMGAGNSRDGHRRRSSPPRLAVAIARRAAANRQLRIALPRPGDVSRARLQPTRISISSCSTNRSGSKTARARRTKWCVRSPAAAVGR